MEAKEKAEYEKTVSDEISDVRIADAIFDNCLFIDGLAKTLGDLCSTDGDVRNGPIEVSAESLWTIGHLIEDQIANIEAKAIAVQERIMEIWPPEAVLAIKAVQDPSKGQGVSPMTRARRGKPGHSAPVTGNSARPGGGGGAA